MSQQLSKRICIVGGGISGLSAIKSVLEEGLRPTCFESRKEIGGIWYYDKAEHLPRARAYESVVTNVSKEASCFSDFPYPDDYAPFITHKQFHRYLKNYAQNFGLEKYIHVNTTVVSVEEKDGLHHNSWLVTTKSTTNDVVKTEEYDCVIICAGRLSKPNMPEFKGLRDGTFKGKVMHSYEYDSAEGLQGKNVLVIGMGNTGSEIAAEVSRTAKQTFLLSRSGAWMLPRTFKNGLPPDLLTSRLQILFRDILPQAVAAWLYRRMLNSSINHKMLGFHSRYDPTSPVATIVVNDELPSRIMSGRVRMKSEIERFSDEKLHFADGTSESIDVVICATGFSPSFPFISDTILPDDITEMRLFEWMIPYNVTNPSSIAAVGIIPFSGGSWVPIIECQTRYIAQVMSGVTQLPTRNVMQSEFERDRVNFTKFGRPFVFKRKIGFYYQDKIARLGGFYPSFWNLIYRDPKLAIAVHCHPFLSYHYRLVGRHQWKSARDRTLKAMTNSFSSIPSDIYITKK